MTTHEYTPGDHGPYAEDRACPCEPGSNHVDCSTHGATTTPRDFGRLFLAAKRNLRNYSTGYTEAATCLMAAAIARENVAGRSLAVWHVCHIMATDAEVPCQCHRPECVEYAADFDGDHGLHRAINEKLRWLDLPPVEAFAVRQMASRQLSRALIRQRRRLLADEVGLVIPEDSGAEAVTPSSVAVRDRARAASCITMPR